MAFRSAKIYKTRSPNVVLTGTLIMRLIIYTKFVISSTVTREKGNKHNFNYSGIKWAVIFNKSNCLMMTIVHWYSFLSLEKVFLIQYLTFGRHFSPVTMRYTQSWENAVRFQILECATRDEITWSAPPIVTWETPIFYFNSMLIYFNLGPQKLWIHICWSTASRCMFNSLTVDKVLLIKMD